MIEPQLHHVAVVARDLDASERFYRTLLGAPVVARHADAEGRPRSVWLGVSGVVLMIERAEGGEPRLDGAPGWHCVAFTIEAGARERERTRLVAAGIAIERESTYSMYVRDPDRNLVALSHYPEHLPSASK